MGTETAAPAESGGYMGKVGDLLLDVARARYVDVERGDEDRRQPDYTEVRQPAQPVPGSAMSNQKIAMIGGGILLALVVLKKVI